VYEKGYIECSVNMTTYCKYCNEEIAFDDEYVSQYSGKKIPLDAYTMEPHDCEANPYRECRGTVECWEYEKCLVGLTAITREAWNTAQNTEDNREKIQSLSLAKECYSMKLELLTNTTVVDDAIRFVSSNKSKENLTLSSSSNNE
jgi:hypothetical protein